jgi:hypothetical protein
MPQFPLATLSGRTWIGYCLIVAAPAVGWVLEDNELLQRKFARMACVVTLLIGVILSATGIVARDRGR